MYDMTRAMKHSTRLGFAFSLHVHKSHKSIGNRLDQAGVLIEAGQGRVVTL